MSKSNEVRCMECSFIGRCNRLEYYPVFYCKINGREVNFCEKNGWGQMKWCPLKEENKGGNIDE